MKLIRRTERIFNLFKTFHLSDYYVLVMFDNHNNITNYNDNS